MKEKLIALLTFTSSLKSFGMKFIRHPGSICMDRRIEVFPL